MGYKMSVYLNSLKIIVLSLVLTGCGGGEGSTTSTNESINNFNNSSVPEYTGLRTPASLDVNLAKEAASDYFMIHDFVDTILLSNLFSWYESSFQAGLNASEGCTGGGSVRLITSKNNSTGVSDIQFSNCTEGGQTLNGRIVFNMDYSSTLLTVNMNHFDFKDGNISSSMSGTLTSLNKKTVEINILATEENKQLLIDKLRIPYPRSSIPNDNTPLWDGAFYYSDKGKIDLKLGSPIDPNRFNTSSALPLLLKDTSNNQATFQPLPSNQIEISFISTDNPTESVYGKVSFTSLIAQISGGGESPIAKEIFTGADNFLIYPRRQDVYESAESIPLDGSESIDPEGALLSFNWSIVESPTDSTATLSNPYIVSPIFKPDYLGEYIIQLIVSDGVISSEPKLIKIHIGGESVDPFDLFGEITWKATQPGNVIVAESPRDGTFGGIPITSLDVLPQAFSLSPPEYLIFSIEWKLLTKPDQSNTVLFDQLSMNPRFNPDIPGEYVLEATINNGFSNFNRTRTILVRDFKRTAVPRISFPIGSSLTTVGVETTRYLHYTVGIGSRNFATTIQPIEKPDGSSPQSTIIINEFSGSDAEIHFLFDKPGKYTFQINASNGTMQINPVDLIFYVIETTHAPFVREESVYKLPIINNSSSFPSMVFGDINKDSFNDIAISWYSFDTQSNQYQILFGKPDLTYTESPIYAAPSREIIGLLNIDNDSRMDILFKANLDGKYTVIPFADTQPQDPFFFSIDYSYNIHSFSDVNNDGLKDIILLYKKSYSPEVSEGVAYSLQQSNGTFLTPTHIEDSKETITIIHDEEKNSLLVLSKSNAEHIIEDEEIIVTVKEYRFLDSKFSLLTSSKVEYPVGAPFYSDVFLAPPKLRDLDADGTKEIIGGFKIGSYYTRAIWKKNTSSQTYQINQKILGGIEGLEFSDIDLDGDIDIITRIGNDDFILYQNEQKLFNSAKIINWNNSGFSPTIFRRLLSSIIDVDHDGDGDMFNIEPNFIDGEMYIRVITNTTY